jgi:anti-sigma factor RsiW
MNAEKDIHDYLLGTLPAERLEELEQRILSDDDFHQEVEIAEEELLDDYVQGKLAVQERPLFEKHFLASPLRQQRLKFAFALQKKLNSAASTSPRRIRSRPASLYPYALAASLVLAALLGATSYRFLGKIQEERANTASLKKQLEEARQQASLVVPNSVLQTNLSPNGSRGGPQPQIVVPKGAWAVRFNLAVPSQLQGKVSVALLNDAGQLIFAQQENRVEMAHGQNVVTATIESKYLNPGDYFLRVRQSQSSPLPEYHFQVLPNQP